MPLPSRVLRGALDLRGGGESSQMTGQEFARLKTNASSTNWIDSTIAFLEAPITDMSVGVLALSLTVVEIVREIRSLGVRDANWALFALALARFMKALLSVLKNTRQALKGYKSYIVLHRGDNVFLRQVKNVDDKDDH